ncbi:MAG: hypothetical protein R3246_16890, partial [Acidimicrobiia bacterium]|nr:hypothetical protein [Acidimicrobiia bacterium]
KLPESVAPKREVCVRVTGSDGAEAEISVSDSDHPALVSFVRNCIDNEAAPIDVVHPSEEVDVAIAKRVPSATPWVIHLRLPQYRPGDSLYLPDDGLGRLLLAPPSAEFATKVIVTGPAGPGR